MIINFICREGKALQNFSLHKMEQEVFAGTYIPWKETMDILEEKKENITRKDQFFMQYALSIAQCGRGGVNPNPLVGAVIVRNGEIVAKGYHEKCGKGHAEVNAFLDAKERGVDVKGADMYITLEPCSHYGKTPPCADRIIEEGIGRVIIAMKDPNPQVAGRGIKKLQQAGISVTVPIMEEEARKLNEVFLKYITKKEPFILLKMAMSLDGKIATKTGKSQWISSEKARKQVHYLRNNYMAVMTGIGTVLADDPMLNCRWEGAVRQPIRIIADSHLRIGIESKLVKTAKEYRTIVVHLPQREKTEKMELLCAAGIELLEVPEKNGHIDLKFLVKQLGSMGIDGILLEGGSDFAFAALQAKIIDKVRIYIAPKIIGGANALSCIRGEGFAELSDVITLQDMKAYPCGEDIYLEGLVK